MEEIQRIADRITVLRDGEFIGSSPAEELPMDKLIEWMVGRRIDQQFPRHAPHPGDVRLRLKNVSVYPKGRTNKPAAEGVSLEVRAGEIVGLGGLQGSGASELLSGIYGAYGLFGLKGRMELDARATRFTGPSAALRNGVALVPADRKTSGLVRSMSITANIAMADGPRVSPLGWRLPGRERRAARTQADELNLVASSLRMEAGQLSGGNQQKVVLGKFLQTRPRLLLLDEPTRGVDVGAKREIYNLMNQWSAEGIAILLITSEMPELLAMSDRIVVMHRGRVTARFETSQASPQDILAAAMGQEYKEATLP
jgi:ABC-type sugar transport system ATPase subunit